MSDDDIEQEATEIAYDAFQRQKSRGSLSREPQMGLQEQTIFNVDLEVAIGDLLATRAAARSNRQAKKSVKRLMPQKPGRYRVGPYLLEVSTMDGGGIEIPEWSALVGRISSES